MTKLIPRSRLQQKIKSLKDGSDISEEDYTDWWDYLNPRNWGITSYDKDSEGIGRTFNQAYKAAREAGEKVFLYKGERYNTSYQRRLPDPVKKEYTLFFYPYQKREAEKVWNYLKHKGVSPKNAAAIMGNIMQESGFNRQARQKGGDRAEGFFQMHGQDLKKYQQWVSSNKVGEYPEIDYVLYMIESKDHPYTNEYKRISNDPSKKSYMQRVYGNRINSGTLYLIDDLNSAWNDKTISLNQITDLFTNTIERPGKPEYKKRQQYATEFYNHFHGVQP